MQNFDFTRRTHIFRMRLYERNILYINISIGRKHLF